MPWKIVRSAYDVQDLTTLHDDELVAIERTLRTSMGEPRNEYNAAWRAWTKVRPLALECSGDDDPTGLLPPGAAGEPRVRDD